MSCSHFPRWLFVFLISSKKKNVYFLWKDCFCPTPYYVYKKKKTKELGLNFVEEKKTILLGLQLKWEILYIWRYTALILRFRRADGDYGTQNYCTIVALF